MYKEILNYKIKVAEARNYLVQKQAAYNQQMFSPQNPLKNFTFKKAVRSGKIFSKLMEIQ